MLHANQATWVQVVDGSGQTLMARLVPAAETVTARKRVLVFTKSSGFEHDAIKLVQKDGRPGYAFPVLDELGRKHNVEVVLEHYVISTGLAEMIRGTSLAAHCDGIYGCEFLEHPLPPHFTKQDELSLDLPTEITQVAAMVDNTIKTRFLFEINKGSNKNAEIDVNEALSKVDGDTLAAEFERYLRRRGPGFRS